MSEKGKTDGASIGAVLILGLVVMAVGRACDSPDTSASFSNIPAPSVSSAEPLPTGIERSSNGDISIDPSTASDDAKRAFVLEMVQRQERAEEQQRKERDVQDQLQTLKHEVDTLKQHADCEQSIEHEYRERGLTLAQVCP